MCSLQDGFVTGPYDARWAVQLLDVLAESWPRKPDGYSLT